MAAMYFISIVMEPDMIYDPTSTQTSPLFIFYLFKTLVGVQAKALLSGQNERHKKTPIPIYSARFHSLETCIKNLRASTDHAEKKEGQQRRCG